MKKLFTFIAMALMAVSASAQTRTTIWQGEQEMGSTWPSIPIAKSEFATAAAGDQIVVTVSKADNSINTGWQWGPQVFIKVTSDPWTDLKDTSAKSMSVSAEPAEAAFDLTADGLAQINAASGIAVQGMNVVVVKVELQSATPTTTSALWEGECSFGNWENGFSIAADKFASVVENDIIEFVYTTVKNEAQPWYQFKTIFADTEETLSSNSSDLNSYGCATVNEGSKSYKITLNAADIAKLKEKGLYVSGKDIIVTKVNLIHAITDGINTIDVAKQQNGVRYNLAGQKVDELYKGVVIMNGRKMIQK